LGFEFDDAAYIGDDISDLTAINAVGIGCCPADAAQEVKHQCDYVSKYEGGEGAVRDIINYLQNSARTVVGVIDAKYDRTELAGGPLTDIDGEAMINHVIKRMIQTDLLENVIVLTNDERVIKTVKSPRVDTFVSDSDQDSHIDRISELAQDIQSDFILDIPWNKPLVDSSHVEAVVNTLIEKAPDVATSMSTINQESRLNDDKSIKIVTDVNGKALYLSRSRIPYGGGTGTAYENTSIYAFKKELLVECGGVGSKLAKTEKLEQLRFLEQGYEVQTTKVDCNSPSVDRKKDITLVEKALKEADDYGT
jgi:CMP-2-keto-3-deoxyoctulosonic acid synthetase